jgi:flagellar assembly protein FliH
MRSGCGREPLTSKWIRPLSRLEPEVEAKAPDWAAEHLRDLLLGDARRRLFELSALERELESRLRLRWQDETRALEEMRIQTEAEIEARRRETEADLLRVEALARERGREDGYREGFASGLDEGRRLGFEKGRLDGQDRGLREEGARLRQEAAAALDALCSASKLLDAERRRLSGEARDDLIQLAMAVASKLVQREVSTSNEVVVRTVERAVDLVVHRGGVVLELHPSDLAVVEAVLQSGPRWVEEFDGIELRGDPSIGRGGCRLLCGAGCVDLTMESQLQLIEEALLGRDFEPGLNAEEEAHREPAPAMTP